jgi:hypothetical protein
MAEKNIFEQNQCNKRSNEAAGTEHNRATWSINRSSVMVVKGCNALEIFVQLLPNTLWAHENCLVSKAKHPSKELRVYHNGYCDGKMAIVNRNGHYIPKAVIHDAAQIIREAYGDIGCLIAVNKHGEQGFCVVAYSFGVESSMTMTRFINDRDIFHAVNPQMLHALLFRVVAQQIVLVIRVYHVEWTADIRLTTMAIALLTIRSSIIDIFEADLLVIHDGFADTVNTVKDTLILALDAHSQHLAAQLSALIGATKGFQLVNQGLGFLLRDKTGSIDDMSLFSLLISATDFVFRKKTTEFPSNIATYQ